MTGAGPRAELLSPRTPHPVRDGGVRVKWLPANSTGASAYKSAAAKMSLAWSNRFGGAAMPPPQGPGLKWVVEFRPNWYYAPCRMGG